MDHLARRDGVMPGVVHVIGAGLAGLAAAVRLAERGHQVRVHEAAGQAGGRCRSYYDRTLEMTIDNGNHLLLSGNRAALAYLRTIGAETALTGPAAADFPFVDLATGERWTLHIDAGRWPRWITQRARRVPGTRLVDYLRFARLFWPPPGAQVADVIACSGALYEKLGRPLLLAALNTEPREGAASLAAAVLRETLAAGGKACRPLIAREGLSRAFIEPALRFLQARGVAVQFGRRLRALEFCERRVAALEFGNDTLRVDPGDAVILAVPATVAGALVPGLETPSQFRAIVNAHFRIPPPAGMAPVIGVINGTAEWIFAYADRLAVTISAADRLLDVPRRTLAQDIWREVAKIVGMSDGKTLPPWQIVRERRATFAALPAQEQKRPGTQTAWNNLWLAGDWTATGLPATIEGAIRSGERAAASVLNCQTLG